MCQNSKIRYLSTPPILTHNLMHVAPESEIDICHGIDDILEEFKKSLLTVDMAEENLGPL